MLAIRKNKPVTLGELREAATAGHLFLMYQPKLDLRSGEVTGVEALARWNHARRGPIDPAQFIGEVERGGLIDWFSEWAIRTAIKQSATWRAEGINLGMAVNISALNLEHVDFPDLVSRICAEENVERDTLTLELTETATQDSTRLMDTTVRFRLKNIGISLDDFGTGYGSLVQLRALPFTELKIDRSFVSDLLLSKDSRAIIRALIQMSHDIGLSVTAEGVEDNETLTALTVLGCDRAQGYFIAHAMPGEQLPLWIRKWHGRVHTTLPNSIAHDGGSSDSIGKRRR